MDISISLFEGLYLVLTGMVCLASEHSNRASIFLTSEVHKILVSVSQELFMPTVVTQLHNISITDLPYSEDPV